MTPFGFVLIACTIISTSFISGLFGMAGGMILVGVLLAYFDVATGMVIFSIIQFAANGWRAVLWWRFVLWRIFFVYVFGAVISFAVMRYIAIVPGKAAVYLGLGDAVPLWTYAPAILLSIAGTSLAAMVLERMTDVGFRQWTRRVIFAVSAVYLARGVMLLAGL